MFQLKPTEKAEVVANCDHLAKLRFSKSMPLAFTEHGAIQAANVLASAQAVEMGIYAVRAFVQLRQMFEAIKALTAPPDPPKRPIGFVTPEEKKGTKGAKAARGRKAA